MSFLEDLNLRQSDPFDAVCGKTSDLPKPGHRRSMPKFSQELTEDAITPIENPENQSGTFKSRELYSNFLAPKRPATMASKVERKIAGAPVEKAVSSQTGTFSRLEQLN